MPLIYLLLFFLSGLTSLIYQMVWLKFLNLTLGVGAYSVAVVLAAFMGGLGMGAWIFGRWAHRIRRPLRLYGILEGGVGLWALATPLLFHGVDAGFVSAFHLFGPDSPLLLIVKFLLSFLILIVPTLCMGGTLPLLVQVAEGESRVLGEKTGLLYGVNTGGAVAGVLVSTFLTIPLYGYHRTLQIAVLFNLIIVLAVLLVPGRPMQVSERRTGSKPHRLYLLLFFFMGFTSLGYEVFWTRILVFYLGSNVYSYGLMLSAFLIGLAAGSLLFSRFLRRIKNPAGLLIVLEMVLGLLILLQLAQFRVLESVMGFFAQRIGGSVTNVFFVHLLGALFLFFLPTLIMGATFPLSLRLYGRGSEESGEDVGLLYLSNTGGSIAGSLLAGFLFLSRLGTLRGVLLYACINVLAAFGLALAVKRLRWVGLALVPLLAALFILPPILPFHYAPAYRGVGKDLVDFKEDAGGTALVVKRGGYLSLEANGINVAGTAPDLADIQKLQGHLPLIVQGSAEEILHIGVGSGGTAYSVSTHPVKKIEIAEISHAVAACARRDFESVNHGVFSDPRVQFHFMDGRSYVLGTPERYDAILSDSIHPKYAGNGFLYTRDYFAMVRQKLAPDGVVSMWLPMYSLTQKNFKEILRAFVEVFPDTTAWYVPTVLNSFTIVIGRMDETPIPYASFQEAFADPKVAADLKEAGIESSEELVAACIMGPKEMELFTRDVRPHVDDHPTVEYESNRIVMRQATWYFNFRNLLKVARFPDDAIAVSNEAKPEVERAAQAARETMRRHLERLYESLR